MTPLRTIIVDDEKLARRGLGLRLKNIPEVEVVAECANGREGLQAIAEHNPDLVFLDIQMPGMDGFGMVCELQSEEMPMIVFVTAFDQYAVQAFEVHALDYMLKPIEEDRLQEAVDRALHRREEQTSFRTKEALVELMQGMNGGNEAGPLVERAEPPQHYPDRLTIKDGGKYQFVRVEDIEWIDAAGDYMCVHAGGKTHIMRTTMKLLESTLDPAVFLRVHRSSIVNANCITDAEPCPNGEYLLTLEGGMQLKVSRSYGPRIKALLEQ